MSGVRSVNLTSASLVDELIGHRDGSTVRIALARLVALISALLGPAHATRAELLADLDWPEGAQGYVRGDAAVAYNGVYRKTGAAGAGSWERIGDLPTGAVEAVQLAAVETAVADLTAALEAEVLARGAGEAGLTADLAAEQAGRVAALAAMAAQMAAEVLARGDGDAAITAALVAESEARATALNQMTGRIEAEVADRAAADTALAFHIAAETDSRAAADADLTAALGTETAARATADSGLGTAIAAETTRARATEALIAGRSRPGDLASAYAPELIGPVTATTPYDYAAVVGDTALGAALRLTTATHVAGRAPLPLEPGRVYQARWSMRRATDPADPLGDAVAIGLRFLDAALAGLADPGGTLVVEAVPLTAALGVQSRTVTLSLDQPGTDHTIPAGARYARAWLRTYGADHVTHAGLVELIDITEAWVADRAAQAGLALKAPLASPALTGVPTAPTAAPGTETTQIATTAWAAAAARTIAQAAVDALIDAAPEQLATLTALAEALGNDPDFAATITGQLAAKADSADVAASFAALGDLSGKDTVATNDVDERAITLSKLAERNQATFLGRRSGEGLGPVQEVSATQARVSLDISNLDNTADADKPLSGPQLAALNARVGDAGAPVDYAGRWFYQGVEVVWASSGSDDWPGLVVTMDGYIRGRLPLLPGANGVEVSEGPDGLWRIGLGTEPGQLPLDGGQVIDTSAELYFQGRKVAHSVANSEDTTGIVICGDGSIALGDDDFREARAAALYFEGDLVEKAEVDRNDRPWRVRLADGRTRMHFDARDLAPFLPDPVPPRILSFGDSLTEGTGGGGTTTTSHLALLTGLEAYNYGIGGQNSTPIAMRLGGTVGRVTVPGNEITSGSNTITAIDSLTLSTAGGMAGDTGRIYPFPLSTAAGNSTRTAKVMIQGVTVTLTRTASGGPPSTTETYTFTPDAGSVLPVTCPPGSPMRVVSPIRAGDWVPIWIGRNDNQLVSVILDNIRNCVAYIRARGAHPVILTTINGNYASEFAGGANYAAFVDLAAALEDEFPVETIDIRRLLISQGLARAGITPTAQDLIDIANDIIPSSLRSDNIHLNAAGYAVVAELIHEHMIARGFVAA